MCGKVKDMCVACVFVCECVCVYACTRALARVCACVSTCVRVREIDRDTVKPDRITEWISECWSVWLKNKKKHIQEIWRPIIKTLKVYRKSYNSKRLKNKNEWRFGWSSGLNRIRCFQKQNSTWNLKYLHLIYIIYTFNVMKVFFTWYLLKNDSTYSDYVFKSINFENPF